MNRYSENSDYWVRLVHFGDLEGRICCFDCSGSGSVVIHLVLVQSFRRGRGFLGHFDLVKEGGSVSCWRFLLERGIGVVTSLQLLAWMEKNCLEAWVSSLIDSARGSWDLGCWWSKGSEKDCSLCQILNQIVSIDATLPSLADSFHQPTRAARKYLSLS